MDSVKDIVKKLNVDFVLPTIQRDFVWLKNPREQKIEKLLDSLMLGYPIGQIILWKPSSRLDEMQTYDFLKSYDYSKDINENERHVSSSKEYLVLDGQQRLTALNIALNGKIITKKGKNVVDKQMYINLFHHNDNEQVNDLSFGFNFLTEQESKTTDQDNLWFLVKMILTNTYNEVEDFKDASFGKLCENQNQEILDLLKSRENPVKKIIGKLWSNIREKKIHCEVTDAKQDEILNVFVRLNDGGVKLEKADLLLSFMENKGDKFFEKGAREEINSFLKVINSRNSGIEGHIKIFKDDVLKACLVLIDDLEIQYKISNFNNSTVQKIASNWKSIKAALETTLELMDRYRIDNNSLSSGNSLLPIAYYLSKNGFLGEKFLNTDNVEHLQIQRKTIEWLALVTFKRVFGASSDTALKNIRDLIKKNNDLPFIMPNVTAIEKEDIETLVTKSQYGKKNTQLLLKFISPEDSWKCQQDHIFPRDLFKKNRNLKSEFRDNIVNLQLLGDSQNKSKNDTLPYQWMNEQSEEYKKSACIPVDIELNEENFERFVEKRRVLIIKRLERFLLK